MSRVVRLALAAITLLGVTSVPAEAGVRVGIGIGIPLYFGPCYGCYRPYYPYYYRPYPAVIVEPAPVLVQPVPLVQAAPAPQAGQQSASPSTASEQLPPAPEPIAAPAAGNTPAAAPNQLQLDIDNHLRVLADRNERVREEAVMSLGRARASRAVDPLAATLAGDPSPAVREAAARALGLIGSPKALPALRRAAQVDSDRDVRRSAQFAIEVVQVANRR